MRLWIAPLVRSRRAVSNGGPLLSVVYDLTCFITFSVLFSGTMVTFTAIYPSATLARESGRRTWPTKAKGRSLAIIATTQTGRVLV